MSETTFDAVAPRVIHPLDDVPEEKLYRADLGRMQMTRGVRLSLMALQGYLLLMLALVGWRALGIAGLW